MRTRVPRAQRWIKLLGIGACGGCLWVPVGACGYGYGCGYSLPEISIRCSGVITPFEADNPPANLGRVKLFMIQKNKCFNLERQKQ
jgi:hypothetical protein